MRSGLLTKVRKLAANQRADHPWMLMNDRDDIRTNLIDSYERLMQFIAKHLNDKFYLEKDQRVSLRDKIFREVD